MSTASGQGGGNCVACRPFLRGLLMLQTPRIEGEGCERMISIKDGGVFPQPSDSLTARRSMRRPTSLPQDALASALDRTTNWLLEQQTEEGYWVGELEGDTILESEHILLLT